LRRSHAPSYCLTSSATGSGQPARGPERSIGPASVRDPRLDENSGERALSHVQILAVNRDRQPQEYLDTY
jgi:hypothetical protein